MSYTRTCQCYVDLPMCGSQWLATIKDADTVTRFKGLDGI